MDVMHIITAIILFLLGGIIASFIMCLADRYGVKTMMGRSVCDDCGKPLSYISLIPFFGAFFSCKYCHKKGGFLYLFFEIIFATVFMGLIQSVILNTEIVSLLLVRGQAIIFFIMVGIISLFGFLGIFDNKHKVFPTKELYLTICLSFMLFLVVMFLYHQYGVILLNKSVNILPFVKYGIVGILWGIPFLLISIFSQEKYMGYGDGLLMVSFGFIAVSVKLLKNIVEFSLYQNIPEIMRYYFYQSITEQFLATLLFASVLGLLLGATYNYFLKKKFTIHRHQAIPFGPPLIMGFLLVLLCF